MTNDSFVAVILCGGSGSRLWPLSRAEYAKPFVQLPGLSASLLQETYRRLPIGNVTPAANCPPCAAVITVAAADNIFLCQQAAADCSAEMLFIGEPVGRNTAPALAAAARWVAEKFGDDMRLLALPADHLVGKPAAFWDAAAKALAAAKDGFALLGITPDHPATGYGYMECGEVLDNGCFAVRQFIEKPDSATATKFLSAGNFLWNAGVFCFTPKTLFAEMHEHAPKLLSSLTAMNPPPRSANEWLPAAEEYAAFPNISFDYALMEKTQNASVAAAADAQWSDVGSWAALQEHIAADANGNRIANMPAVSTMLDISNIESKPNQNEDNNALLQDSKNCFVVSAGGRLVTGVGLEDLHIIDTPDALLISAAAKSQEVRKIYDTLQTQKRRQATTPTTVHRPWGFYTVLAESPNHKVKRITVNPGGILSLQSHNRRSEHWTTVQGIMSVVINEQEFDMPLDKSCHIPLGAKHRMQNKTDSAASIIEVQIGDYLGEDDIIRYEDIYGRVPSKS